MDVMTAKSGSGYEEEILIKSRCIYNIPHGH